MDGMLVLAPVLVPRLLLFAFYPGMCVPQTRKAQPINYLTRAIAKAKPQKRPSFGRSNSRDIGRGRALTERTTLDRSTIIDLFRQAGTSRRARVKSRDADSPLEEDRFNPRCVTGSVPSAEREEDSSEKEKVQSAKHPPPAGSQPRVSCTWSGPASMSAGCSFPVALVVDWLRPLIVAAGYGWIKSHA